jgi:quinol monooxygenase YgiN
MMIITGDLLIKDGSMHQAMQACQKHVAHSRTEIGCIRDAVYQDLGNALRLFFVNNGKINQASMHILFYLVHKLLLQR